MSTFPDKSLRKDVPKQFLSSVCAMLGFDYMRVIEIQIYRHVVTVRHIDENDNISDTEIPVR